MISYILQVSCSRPFWDLLANGDLEAWLTCPYAIGGLTAVGVGLFLWAIPFVGLHNWSESWSLPLTWTAIVVPVMGLTLLPGSVLRRIAGLLTIAVAGLLIGLYWWWGRS